MDPLFFLRKSVYLQVWGIVLMRWLFQCDNTESAFESTSLLSTSSVTIKGSMCGVETASTWQQAHA